MTQLALFDLHDPRIVSREPIALAAAKYRPLRDVHPPVPWTRWPTTSREVEDLRVELGHRAAADLVVRPFIGWNGARGYQP